MNNREDGASRASAERIAGIIADYWRARGRMVTVTIISARTSAGYLASVRSDMRRGWPTGSGAVFFPERERSARKAAAR